MLQVIKSYAPFLLWLVLAAFTLFYPGMANAQESAVPVACESFECRLRLAHTLVERRQWADAARLKLPSRSADAWTSRDESEFVFLRGLGAARAGFKAMASYSIERLGELREMFLAEGQGQWARESDMQAWIIATWMEDPYLNR